MLQKNKRVLESDLHVQHSGVIGVISQEQVISAHLHYKEHLLLAVLKVSDAVSLEPPTSCSVKLLIKAQLSEQTSCREGSCIKASTITKI